MVVAASVEAIRQLLGRFLVVSRRWSASGQVRRVPQCDTSWHARLGSGACFRLIIAVCRGKPERDMRRLHRALDLLYPLRSRALSHSLANRPLDLYLNLTSGGVSQLRQL